MKDFATQKLKAAIKQQLRLKKATYQDLAAHLSCSVPTVKRILGSEEITLNRTLQILEFLDLTLSELELLASQGKEERPRFTPEQETFLVKNPNYFAFLLALHNGKTPKKIADEFQLNQKSLDKYLLGLERAGLIRVTGRSQVKPAYKQLPALGKGALAKAYYASVIRTGAEFFIRIVQDSLFAAPGRDEPKGPAKFFTVQTVKVSAESYQRYTHEQRKAEEEFIRLSQYEEKTRPEGELQTAVTLQAAALVPSAYPPLNDLENVFGKITPL